MRLLRRALQLSLRILGAAVLGGTIAIGPRAFQPRLPHGARIELVMTASESDSQP